ncbi:MAG: type II toxin-antitoxin system VapC family toxin [Sterolibacteriaceae bacterium]|nr:type II toxin-antitoxin system VapC family toxin [Sterolibacteriaceae bacterium]
MRAVDTNLLVRLLVRDDAAQVDAAEAFVEQGAWVSHLVLAEALWVLDAVYDRSPAQLAKAIDLLLNHRNLTLQDADVIASALAHFRARPSLGFSDCLVLEIARKAGHQPLGTFDKSLARLDGACAV